MDENVKLIEALAKLAVPLAWPVAILISLWLFRTTISNFFESFSEGSFKGFGFEATAKRTFVQAIAKAASSGGEPSNSDRYAAEILADSISFSDLHGKRVLWIASLREKYESERLALTSLGLQVKLITTEREDVFSAIQAIRTDIIITEGMLAGGTFLHVQQLMGMLRKVHLSIPVIVYNNLRNPAEEDKVRELGISDWATDPSELMRTVTDSLQPSVTQRLKNLTRSVFRVLAKS
ncbi:hypothetical protein [Bradyrhizobium liaoningense]|uniref:hypothetical protein n=1 Tax=Bradyrhizobium liaoningense TaxID=43992 RepID=UPI001BA90FA0|nr:hypothetical protein [Bradyrhizobium liaoningense]MBR1165552.1 hypothetical protein [Bradyrhizobium liaoningense]